MTSADGAIEYFTSMLSEGFHTAFRKAVPNSDTAHKIWTLINDMPDDEWNAIIDFVVSGMNINGNVEIKVENE